MNHSVYMIRDYVCQFYGVTEEELCSRSIKYRVVRARQTIVLLTGRGRDSVIASVMNRYRCQIPIIRKTAEGYLGYDKELTNGYKTLKAGLMDFEISELRHIA